MVSYKNYPTIFYTFLTKSTKKRKVTMLAFLAMATVIFGVGDGAGAGAAAGAAGDPSAGSGGARSASDARAQRTVQDLTAGWRFKLGNLPYDGGPLLCSDQAHAVAYPINLAGKACDLGTRDRWARIESGGRNNLPDDCARACCTNSNCTVWLWNNNTRTSKGPPLGPSMPATAYGDCYLGYGEHDVATECSASPAFLGGARSLPPSKPPYPPRPAVPAGAGAEASGFDDSSWREVSTPHDFVIEGKPCFAALGCDNADQNSNAMHGSYPKGIGWYRRQFSLGGATAAAVAASSAVVFLHFEGCLNDCQVFVNGRFLHRAFGGFAGFRVPLPATLVRDAAAAAAATQHHEESVLSDAPRNAGPLPFTLAVRTDSRTNIGWFYEGGGLNRPVHLVTVPAVRIEEEGVFVVATPHGSLQGQATAPTASVQISTEVTSLALQRGATGGGNTFVLQQDVIDARSRLIVGSITSAPFAVGSSARADNYSVTQHISLENAPLWSLESARLHILRTRLLPSASVPPLYTSSAAASTMSPPALDEVNVTFGIRRAVFDANNGFALNDEKVQIRGFCNHETFGGTGAAIPPRINEYRLASMKEMGANGWRAAHEPPASDLLASADRLGVLVWAENRLFGQDPGGMLPEDQITDNIEAMIRRDRNHPSIIIWSLCNEEGCIQRSAEQAVRKGVAAKKIIHATDGSRPMSAALNFGATGKECQDDCLAPTLEVVGMNYNEQQWDAFHANYSKQPMIASEMTRSNSVRGIYQKVSTKGYEPVWNAAPGYLNSWTQINSRHEWLAGGFLWTGFDYLGEPNNPDMQISASFGAIDVAGFPKDSYYFFRGNWTAKAKGPQIHIVPSHWNFAAAHGNASNSTARVDATVRVWVFANSAVDAVVVKLNGKLVPNCTSAGISRRVAGAYVDFGSLVWKPGELVAEGLDAAGQIIVTDSVTTATQATSLKLTIDYNKDGLLGNGQDVFLARVAIVDAKGRLVPDASNNVTFKVTGAEMEPEEQALAAARRGPAIYGVANGDPSSYESDKAVWRSAFNGLVRAIVSAGESKGNVTLLASSPGLLSDAVTVVAH